MVGREDIPIIRLSNHDDKNDNSTYSMRKEKKKADIQMSEEYSADNQVDNGDYMKLVDNFVQGVIERAKQEYLGSCANSGVETGVRQMNEEDRLLAGNLLSCSENCSSPSAFTNKKDWNRWNIVKTIHKITFWIPNDNYTKHICN